MTYRTTEAAGYAELIITDADGDKLHAQDKTIVSGQAAYVRTSRDGAYLTAEDARALIDHLEPVAAPKKPAEPDPGELVLIPVAGNAGFDVLDQLDADPDVDHGLGVRTGAFQAGFWILTPAAVAALGEFTPVPDPGELVQIRVGTYAERRSLYGALGNWPDAVRYTDSGVRAWPEDRTDPAVRFLSADAVASLGEFRPVEKDLYTPGDRVVLDAGAGGYFSFDVREGQKTVIARSRYIRDIETYVVEDSTGARQHIHARDLHLVGGRRNCPSCQTKEA